MNLPRLLLLPLLLAAPALIYAAARLQEPAGADPSPQQEAAPLLRLLPGKWRGEQEAQGVRLLENASWEWALGGQFLECRVESSDPTSGAAVFEGRGFLRHDANLDSYTFHWFDSNGAAKSYTGRCSGEALLLESTSPGEQETICFEARDEAYRCSARKTGQNGVSLPLFDVRYQRLKDKKE
ncbi:MAG: hypothetical protein HY812_12025 [Planctomycetes bacterium]|nr:hypothetical protein [Planctomycetota bacterium]